ncbi:MAG: SRPBCC family protein [Solirubrobacteraceae bacterium]
MLTYEAASPAPAEQAWPLLARPNRWHEWAPHVRGASGVGDDEVQPGRRGAAMLMGVRPGRGRRPRTGSRCRSRQPGRSAPRGPQPPP